MNAVEITGLRYSYPDGRPALHGIDLIVREGESVGLIGANGSGKTTLLLHLNGILRGTGSVRIFGMDPSGPDRAKVRAAVGVLFQDPEDQLFCPTVMEDAEFGPLNMGMDAAMARTRAREALERVSMSAHAERPPHHLSAGEKKRAALAAVVAVRPRILALDEPSANLDPRSRREMIGLLKSFDGTRILAGHDLELIRGLCPRVILMNLGKIAADGPAGVILDDRAFLEASGL